MARKPFTKWAPMPCDAPVMMANFCSELGGSTTPKLLRGDRPMPTCFAPSGAATIGIASSVFVPHQEDLAVVAAAGARLRLLPRAMPLPGNYGERFNPP